MAKAAKAPETPTVPDEVRTALQGGRLTAEEAITRTTQAEPTRVVVKENVYEQVADPYATTTRRVLRYHKGQVITDEEAKANKVTAIQQQNVAGTSTK